MWTCQNCKRNHQCGCAARRGPKGQICCKDCINTLNNAVETLTQAQAGSPMDPVIKSVTYNPN